MKRPLALLGLPGCGKTYWGRQIASDLNIKFYDLDELIANQAGMSIPHIFQEDGEALFRSIESSTLFSIFNSQSHEKFILALGGGTPAYNDNMNIVLNYCTSVYLNITEDTIVKQLQNDAKNHRPLVKKASDQELRAYISKLKKEREMAYMQANYMLYENELSIKNFKTIINDNK